jgi:glutamate-1-semialdehyde 2,1-aminomutase
MTAALYGHSNSVIKDTLVSTAQTVGLNVGATTKLEARYALLLCTRFSLDRIRFCNSGTEANMHALAAARKLTGKRKVVVFANGYHGAVLAFPGGKPAENNVDLDDWIIARYNDIDSATTAIRTEGVCAVILEGMQGSGGAIPGTRDFLHAVQKVAKEAGVLFILDEVMTSRLSPGGLAEIFDLTPDIKTFGKYLGGGLAFGAFGGKQEAMKVFDPREPGALVHSGTFNNNTLVMACGHAGLSQIFTPEACKEFNKLGDWMLAQLNEICRGTKLSFTGRGTIQCAHFTANGTTKILRAEDVDEDSELRDLFWMEMLEAGFWTSKGAKFALILGTPKTEIERFLEAVKDFLDKYRQLIKL